MATPPDPLDPLFERWRADTPTLRRSVTSEVWHRIDRAEEARNTNSIFARIERVFRQPAFAVAFVAVCVSLGLFFAETRLSGEQARRTAELEQRYLNLQLEQRYLQMLDPRVESTAATITPTSHQP
jgi:hypothetical protein